MSLNVAQCRSMSRNVARCRSMALNAARSRSISLSVAQCLCGARNFMSHRNAPSRIDVAQCRLMSLNVSHCRSMSLCVGRSFATKIPSSRLSPRFVTPWSAKFAAALGAPPDFSSSLKVSNARIVSSSRLLTLNIAECRAMEGRSMSLSVAQWRSVSLDGAQCLSMSLSVAQCCPMSL